MESTSPQEPPSTCNCAASSLTMYHTPVCDNSDSKSPPLLCTWASLHGKPCTLEEYLQLSVSDWGKYDLIKETLVARDMPDSNHDHLVNAYKAAVDHENAAGETAFVDATIAIPDGTLPSSSSQYRYRVPDISVGTTLSTAERENLPSAYRDVTWTPRNPPRLVGEVTSNNAGTDLNEKAHDYAKAGVSRYLIVDRDKHREGTERHKPTVRLGRLEGNAYKFTTYKKHSSDRVGSPGPLHHEAEVLLDPHKLNRITEIKKERAKVEHQREQKKRKEAEERERREKEEREKAEKRERREKEERRKAEEEREKAEKRERREKEERRKAEEERRKAEEEREKAEKRERREKEKRKKAEKRARVEKRKSKSMKDRLRALGEPVSDSSSECSSPARKKY